MSNRLLYNSISSTFLYTTNVIIAFIMSPVLINALGNRDYGLWELIMSFIGYMGLFDLGLGTALVRFVSVADGDSDRTALQETVSTVFVFFVTIGVICFFVFWSVGSQYKILFSSEASEVSNIAIIVFLLGSNFLFLFPQQVFSATLMGIQKHYFVNYSRVFIVIIKAVVVYFLLINFSSHSLLILAILTPVFTFIQLSIFSGAFIFDPKLPTIRLASVKINMAKEMFRFASKTAVMMVAGRLQNYSIPFIIGHTVGLSYIVYFVIPNRLVQYAQGLSQAVGFPLAPYFGFAIGKGDSKGLKSSWLSTSLAMQVISFSMPILIFFTGESFIRLWLGLEYAQMGKPILYILLCGLLADAFSSNSFLIMTAQGRHGKCALMWLFFSVASIPLGVWAAINWGLIGVALTTTSVTVIAKFITLYMACNSLEIKILIYYRETISKIVVPLLLFFLSLYFFSSFFPLKSYLYIVLCTIFSYTVYSISLYTFTLNSKQKKSITDKLISFTN